MVVLAFDYQEPFMATNVSDVFLKADINENAVSSP